MLLLAKSHSSLDVITPNDAISDPKKRMHVMHFKILKAQDNGFVADLKPGDKVSVNDTAMFKKGTESRSSDEVHVVRQASRKTVTLTDGTRHQSHNTVMVPPAQLKKNVITVASTSHQAAQGQAAVQAGKHQGD